MSTAEKEVMPEGKGERHRNRLHGLQSIFYCHTHYLKEGKR